MIGRNNHFIFLGGAVISMLIFALWASFFSFAASYIDDSQIEFDLGVYSNTQFDGGNSWVEFDGVGLAAGSGSYTSVIFDAGDDSSWDGIGFEGASPSSKGLLDSGGAEVLYDSGNVDMSDNQLLYHFGESAGPVADTSGSGISGTVDGASLGATGVFGDGLDVTGNGDLVENNAISMSFGSEITLMAWFKYSGAGTGSPRILELSRNGNADSHALAPDDDGSMRAWVECATGVRVGSVDDSANYNDGDWHHMAYTYSSPNAVLYIDGVATDTGSGACADLDDPTVLTIGAISDVSGNYAQTDHEFDGYVDEVAVFDSALSAADVLNTYERGARGFRFQVRSCDDSACVSESFIGPDGTGGSYYEWGDAVEAGLPFFTLTNVSDNRYFQYRAGFISSDVALSPELKSVTVDYTILNSAPDTPVNGSPGDGVSGVGVNTSLTASVFNDADLDTHADSEWGVDDNSDFSSPVWTRSAGVGEEATSIDDSAGVFGSELAGQTSLLGGGTYYWRVRYRDSAGNWSAWSASTSFTTGSSGGGGGGHDTSLLPPDDLSLVLNGGDECVADGFVRVELYASNAAEVYVSNDSLLIGGEWIPLPNPMVLDWQLVDGDGERRVYAIFRSKAGTPSFTVSDSILVDSSCDVKEVGDSIDEDFAVDSVGDEVGNGGSDVAVGGADDGVSCDVGCEENEYVLYIVNPDGTRRESGGDYARMRLTAGYMDIGFEDKGSDMDFNDVVLRLDASECPIIQVDLLELNAGWDHKIGLDVIRDGVLIDDEIVFESSQAANSSGGSSFGRVDLQNSEFACLDERPVSFARQYIEVFSLPNFEGDSEVFEVGADSDLLDSRIGNDSISSVRLIGGVIAEFFSDISFNGILERIFTDDADLSDNAVGGISSVNVVPVVVYQDAILVESRVGSSAGGWGGGEGVEVVEAVEGLSDGGLVSDVVCESGVEFVSGMMEGDISHEVRFLQEYLQCLGFFPADIASTAIFGPLTRQAVVDFQVSRGLDGVGVVGADTLKALNEEGRFRIAL